MVMGGGIKSSVLSRKIPSVGSEWPASESRPYKSIGKSAHKAAGGYDAAESRDEGNVGKTGDGDSTEPPVAVVVFFAEKPWIRPRRAAIEDGGHDAPLDPADGHVDREVSDGVFGKAGTDVRNERAAKEVDQNPEEKSHEQAEDSETDGLRGQESRLRLKHAQTDVAPEAVGNQFDDEIERTVECSHGGYPPYEDIHRRMTPVLSLKSKMPASIPRLHSG